MSVLRMTRLRLGLLGGLAAVSAVVTGSAYAETLRPISG